MAKPAISTRLYNGTLLLLSFLQKGPRRLNFGADGWRALMGPNGGKRKGPAEDGGSSSHPDNTLITQSARPIHLGRGLNPLLYFFLDWVVLIHYRSTVHSVDLTRLKNTCVVTGYEMLFNAYCPNTPHA
ncbi:hypothetical protein CDAR_238961 [Caerostris darwini]|uniref:Uncharacterized protein n=1 Tax=Caerostris darwini TaxID=1538125 RepID=A0AAV4PVR9_9ARAC|nr:hypothetical protein CDAR_238961 [Caerostris darwini]